jgi:hypothetical protein
MYKIPDVPSPEAEVHEIADFIEIECIRNDSVSAREIFSSLDLLDDHYYRTVVGICWETLFRGTHKIILIRYFIPGKEF